MKTAFKKEKNEHEKLLELLQKHFFEDEQDLLEDNDEEDEDEDEDGFLKRMNQSEDEDEEEEENEDEEEDEDEMNGIDKDKRKNLAILLITKKAARANGKKM